MKYIIKESQINFEMRSDALYKLIQLYYPNNYEYDASDTMSEVYEDDSKEFLLFYYDWDSKGFYISEELILNLFENTALPFFNLTEIKLDNRETFDNMIKVFAKRYYGWNVNKVWFHWY